MPRLRLCGHPGCHATTTKGRCAKHGGPSAIPAAGPRGADVGGPGQQAKDTGHRAKPWRTTHTSAHARGYGRKWQKLRKAKLAESPICEACKRAWAVCVDHITPKAQGGSDDWENLQSLCQACHDQKTARDGGRGSLVPPDQNAWR